MADTWQTAKSARQEKVDVFGRTSLFERRKGSRHKFPNSLSLKKRRFAQSGYVDVFGFSVSFRVCEKDPTQTPECRLSTQHEGCSSKRTGNICSSFGDQV